MCALEQIHDKQHIRVLERKRNTPNSQPFTRLCETHIIASLSEGWVKKMITTSTYETLSIFILISILLFTAIAIIYLTHISQELKKLKKETKETHKMFQGITAEKLETNHNILSEISINTRKLLDKKQAKKHEK